MPTSPARASAPTDEELMAHIAAGEEQALTELYGHYSRSLFVFCRHLTCRDVAADLVHDCFLRVVSAAARFDPEKASVSTWLFRIARNRCIDWKRSRGERPGEPLEAHEPPASRGDPSQPEGAAMRSELMRIVRECISALGQSPVREALLMYHMGGKVYREIGQVLGRSTSMARKLVNTAQESVKRCLEKKGVDSLA